MRPLEMIMLAVQVAVLLAAGFAIVMRKPTAGRRRPLWTSLAFSILVIASVSYQISDKHSGDLGSVFLGYGAVLLLGFALAMMLMAFRERRFGTDA